MANPNWPSFPGVPNMSLDGDGRPQAQDLIPGKQLGTPLNAAFINQLIDTLCRLADGNGTLTDAKVNRAGDTMSGDLTITGSGTYGQTLFGGKVASTVSGHAENSFLQTQIIDDKPYAVLGIQDAQGAWHTWYFNAVDGTIRTPEGHTILEVNDVGDGHIIAQNIGSASGKILANVEDVGAVTRRAEAIEARCVPSNPRDGHDDSPINNLIYDNNNGGNPAVSVVGKGIIWLQAAGDYATNAALNALEKAKVNRTGDTMSGDLMISSEASWGQTLFGGKCVSVVAGQKSNSYLQTQIVNGNTEAVVGVQDTNGTWHNWSFNAADGSVSTPSGKTLATTDTVRAETQRAQDFENRCVPSNPRDGHNDSPINNFIYDNNNGGNPAVSVVGKGFIWLQAAGDYATNSALNAETQRSQNAEAALLPLSGGTLTGDTILLGNTWQNNLFSRTLRLRADSSGLEGTVQLLGNTSNPVLSLGVTDSNKNRQSWALNAATGTIVTPSGNIIPETRGVPGRVVTQYFRISNLANVNYIPFPAPFTANDPVNEIFITYGYGYNDNGGSGESSVLYIYKQRTTNNGFWIDRSLSGFQDAAFDVVVTGPMK